ncbi:MAG: hypothetical protein AB1597_01845, partial [Chloroflexota bacterium]
MKKVRPLTAAAILAVLLACLLSVIPFRILYAAPGSVGVDHTYTATTQPPSNITACSATLHGTFIVDPADVQPSVGFYIRKAGTTGWADVGWTSAVSGSPISYNMTGLISNTQYEYKIAVGPYGTDAQGSVVSFTTERPSLTPGSATGITVSEATIRADLTYTGDCSMWGYFEYGETASYGLTTYQTNNWMSSGTQSFTLTGLKASTTYYFRLYVEHGSGADKQVYRSSGATFTTLSPALATQLATNVTVSSATIHATLNWTGNATFWGYFEYGLTTSYRQTTAGTNNWLSAGPHSYDLTGLKPGSTYYYRLMAKYGEQYFYSPGSSFTTLSPTATTGTASNITNGQATLGGSVTWTGTKNFDVIFEYGTGESYGNQVTIYPGESGPVSRTITGLHAGTLYHYRLIARNDSLVFAGQDATFTTSTPQVTTSAATGIGNTFANLNGSVTFTGPPAVTPGFDYGPTTAYGNSVNSFEMSESGNFGGTLSGLPSGTTHHFCAKVTTAAGDVFYGTDLTFTTTATAPAFLFKFGSGGGSDGQLNEPTGIATDASGNVYVADTSNNRIQKFSSTGTFITKWGSAGNSDGQFNGPMGIAVDATGNVYVADQNNQRIQKFTSDGNFITKWGSLGGQNGQFNNPFAIAIDATGNLYVADQNNQRIQKFTSDGNFITKWGSAGSDDGQFADPNGIAVDSAGNVYVSDLYHYRIQKFSSTGAFITKWGSQGSGDSQFNYPQGLAVDQSGYVYIADANNHRIQKFTSTGAFVTKWGTFGTDDGQFNQPRAVAVNTAGNIYVIDYYNARIQAFGVHVPPVVATGAATSVGSSTATLNGNLSSMGTTTTVNVSFEYGTTTSYGTTTTAQARTTAGSFSAAITSLDASTTYHYRAKADGGAAGVANGNDMSFNTLSTIQAETALTQGLDTGDVAIVSVKINRIKDGSGNTTAIPGGIGGFSATASSSQAASRTGAFAGMEFTGVTAVAPYLNPT